MLFRGFVPDTVASKYLLKQPTRIPRTLVYITANMLYSYVKGRYIRAVARGVCNHVYYNGKNLSESMI